MRWILRSAGLLQKDGTRDCELANWHDMEVVFETARMYKGKCPELPLKRLYGVTSFELG
jgi:hypothetical protein